MAHFAHVNKGIVDSVIVIEETTIQNKGGWDCPECGTFKPISEWVQTSYNTQEGVNKLGGTALRKNFAGKGYSYDTIMDAFIPPKGSEDFILDVEKGVWKAPKAMPKVDLDANTIVWDETTKDWSITPRK